MERLIIRLRTAVSEREFSELAMRCASHTTGRSDSATYLIADLWQALARIRDIVKEEAR